MVLDKTWTVDPQNIHEVLAAGGYRALEKIFSDTLSPEQVIEEVKKSGLRGRGGAGFPTGMKWEFTRKAAGSEKYVICNADEGEPGTFKDRLILEGDPHKLIEAMTIAAYAIGAGRGYVYIRGEYGLSIERMQKAIDQAREFNLLGENILETGFSFDLEIKKGAGAYVCGEETALIESLEGKRGNPRVKPPYPVSHGLWQKPTAVNNVETLANIPAIIGNGAGWFRKIGTDKCPGTKVFTILGHVEYPGLIETDMGTAAARDHFLLRRRHQGRQKIQGRPARRRGRRVPFRTPAGREDGFREPEGEQGGAGLGRRAGHGRGHLDRGHALFHRQVLRPRVVRPVRPLPHRHAADPADHLPHPPGRRPAGRPGEPCCSLAETMFKSSLCPLGQSLVMPVKSALENFEDEFALAISHAEKS